MAHRHSEWVAALGATAAALIWIVLLFGLSSALRYPAMAAIGA